MLTHATLFLDLDGTLVELVARPDSVVADEDLRALLPRLAARLEGRLAIVSGRSLAQLDAILGACVADLALAGSHGSEYRWQGLLDAPDCPAALDEATVRLRARFGGHPDLIIEEKSHGVTLHYRLAPELAEEAGAHVGEIARALGLYLQEGKMMVELRTPGADKASAVRRLMAEPAMAGTRPVFVGDDLTDEPGFIAAAALGGDGILVGDRWPSAAHYALPDHLAVREWLRAFAG